MAIIAGLTRRVSQWTGGYAARFQEFLPGFEFIPFQQRVSSCPPAINAHGWAPSGTFCELMPEVVRG